MHTDEWIRGVCRAGDEERARAGERAGGEEHGAFAASAAAESRRGWRDCACGHHSGVE